MGWRMACPSCRRHQPPTRRTRSQRWPRHKALPHKTSSSCCLQCFPYEAAAGILHVRIRAPYGTAITPACFVWAPLLTPLDVRPGAAGRCASRIGHLVKLAIRLWHPIWLSSSNSRQLCFRGRTMTTNTDVQALQGKAEAQLAALRSAKLVTRIAVVSTSLGQGKKTERLMIGMSVETHKTAPDFDQKKCSEAKSRIMQALGDIDCDVFIEMDR